MIHCENCLHFTEDIICELLGWFTAEKETTAQMGLHRTEKLWMNFNPELQLSLKE